ncbi:prepilin-type N-terminal cleavage/methylation domain-containing protein [Bacillus sp. ISL-7]|uniref:type IV pilus modification PilV family protein n=1 Tax=Bacillus sp. ISL-7 TaxID=2819136 RepID=UPI001BEC8E76|nr:prepilin-type N-terminal cleavage/methylation domain-containing protein [Bacillus sp. ISL-7]MBT2735786.1 prepilin-type N-terminal cleavage/methylation domain-containing protein [Bacillus sp. ISL-7]
MKFIQNDKGVTLIEVLVSIVLLSIIFLSFMSFFPQMGLMNNQNQDKAKAINIAKEVLVNWQESSDVKWFLVKTDQVIGFTSTDPKVAHTRFSYDPTYYYFETTKDNYDVNIKINRFPETSSRLSSINSIVVQLLDKKNRHVVSETFGYVKR